MLVRMWGRGVGGLHENILLLSVVDIPLKYLNLQFVLDYKAWIYFNESKFLSSWLEESQIGLPRWR